MISPVVITPNWFVIWLAAFNTEIKRWIFFSTLPLKGKTSQFTTMMEALVSLVFSLDPILMVLVILIHELLFVAMSLASFSMFLVSILFEVTIFKFFKQNDGRGILLHIFQDFWNKKESHFRERQSFESRNLADSLCRFLGSLNL